MLTRTLTSAVLSIVFLASSGPIHSYATDYGSKSSFGNEGIIYHNNKSEDGNYFNDLRGYPNSSPIFKLKDAITHEGNGSLSFVSPKQITCNGNLNFTVPSNSCEASITIAPPSSTCQINSLSYTITGGPSAPTGTTSSDPSGIYPVGSYNIMWSITDCDGPEVCMQTINVLDMTAPTLTCPMSLNLDCINDPIPQTYDTFAEFVAAGGTISDNCMLDESSFELQSEVINGTPCNQTITRTYRILDVNSQGGICTRSIFIQDNILPTFTEPDDITINCDQDPDDLTITGDVTNEADNCNVSIPEATYSDTNSLNECNGNQGFITRIWSLTDDCGNTRNRTQIITIQDNTAPIIDCSGLSNLVLECDGDYTSEINNWLAANESAVQTGASDNCSNITVSNNYIAGTLPAMSCMATAGITVTFTATDDCGNVGSCMAQLILDDNTAPIVDCSVVSNLVLECDGDYTTEINTWLNATETAVLNSSGTVDQCGGTLTISNNYAGTIPATSCDASTGTAVTFTVTDGCMNSASCTVSIIINDTVDPTFIVPGNVSISCEQDPTDLAITGDVTDESDNCSMGLQATFSDVTTAGTCADESTITRTWTLVDGCGNDNIQVQTITITDDIDPTFTVPGNVSISCEQDPTDLTLTGDVTDESDNCAAGLQATFSDVTTAGTCADENTITRTWTLVDACGNDNVQVQTITIVDSTNPTFTVPNSLTISCEQDPTDLTITGDVTDEADNCSVGLQATFSDASVAGTCADESTITRTWTLVDACGNDNVQVQTITVTDNVDPVAVCQNVSLTLDATGSATLLASQVDNGSSDNCDTDLEFSLSRSTFFCNDVISSPIAVTMTVTDNCGNTDECIVNISIIDNVTPVLTCPAALTAVCNITEQPTYADFNAFLTAGGTFSDMCDANPATFMVSEVSDNASCPETVTRTYSISDFGGNNISCQQTIVVDDNILPTITCPSNIIQNNDSGNCSANVTIPTPTTSDNCGVQSVTNDFNNTADASGIYPEGTTAVIFTVTDLCGNTSTCSMSVTINDTELPTINCPATLTTVCTDAEQSVYADFVAFQAAGGSASDNCGLNMASFTFVGQVSDGNTCPEMITRTYQIADVSGNTNTCTQVVMVDDNINPSFTVPASLTISCEQDPNDLSITGDVTDESDNCTVNEATFLDATVVGTCANESTITRTWSLSDDCGNTIQQIQTISIEDNTSPILNCGADFTVNVDAGVCNAMVTIAVPNPTDNCGSITLVNNYNGQADATDMYPIGTTMITWTATDACNNTSTCSINLTVEDNIDPTISCPSNIIAVCGISEQPMYADLAAFMAAGGMVDDNCGIDATSFTMLSETSNGAMCPEVVTRVYQISDNSGNTATCSHTITIDDEDAPTFTCGANITVNVDAGVCTSMVSIAVPSPMDNCGVTSLVNDFNNQADASGMYPLGNTTVTWTATDGCDNLTTCEIMVTVLDNIDPMITCPADLTAVCGISEQPVYADLAAFTAAGGSTSDNCGINATSFTMLSETSNGATCPEVVTRVYQISDDSGNTATCSQMITINDEVVPTITCPTNITVSADAGECTAAVTIAIPTTGDNCGVSNVVNDFNNTNNASGTYPVGTTTVEYTVTDACDNETTCSFTVTVNDTEAPMITCPANLIAVCGIGEQPAYADLAAFTIAGGNVSDNCGINAASFTMLSETSDGAMCPEVVTRVYQITDVAGLSSTCSQTITINDEVDPMITCPTNISVNAEAGECTASVTIAIPTTSDNCGVINVVNDFNNTNNASGTYPVGTTTVVYTVTDACDNETTCSFTVTVNDTESPTINCPTNLTAVCGISEQPAYSDLAAFTAAGGSVSDNCGINSSSFIFLSEESNGASCPEVVTRVYQIADDSGLMSTCSQTITIDDDTPPTLNCGADFTVNVDAGVCTAMVTIAVPNPTDDCGIVSLVNDYNGQADASDMYPIGTTMITWTATDACNNTSTCSINLTVEDNIDPTISCPSNLTAVCGIAEQPAYADLAAFMAAGGMVSDNCGIDATSFTMLSETSNGAMCPEVVTRVYQIADASGNTATCSQTVTIDDETDPVLMNCPGDITINADTNLCQATVTLAVPTATDNCNSVTITNNITATADASGVFLQGITQVIWTATDGCGNTATCIASVTVEDNMPPIVGCPNDLSAQCSTAEQTPYATFAEFTTAGGLVLDNCGVDASSFTYLGEVSDGMSCPETFTRTYQIADIFGNTTTCIQMVVVNDDINPTIACPGDITVNADSGVCSAAITLAVPTTNDNCSVTSVVNDFNGTNNASGTYPLGTTTVTYTVTDGCENTATCSFTVTVNDTEAPTITCPANLTAVCSLNEQMSYVDLAAFQAAGGIVSDNCGIDATSFTMLSETSNGANCPEVVTRVYQISDDNGLSATCSQTITIDDDEAPTFTCGANITVNVDAGQCTAMVSIAVPNPTDNCEVTSLVNDFNNQEDASGMYPIGNTNIIWTATDACGNSNTCQIMVTVVDNISPTITCPVSLTAVCSVAEQPVYADLAAFVAAGGSVNDNCGIDATSFTLLSETSNGASCPEVVTRVYQISDDSGTTATCSQTMTIDDDTAPVLNCGADFTVNVDAGLCTAMVTIAVPDPVDNCEVVSLVNDYNNQADASDMYPLGTTMITWTATDACGNSSTCNINLTVIDNINPTITCPPSLAAVCGIVEQPAYADLAAFALAGGNVSDNCSIDASSFTLLSETSNGASCPELVTRVYQISDDSGNTATCSQSITINDEVPPVLMNCPANITVDTDTDLCQSTVTLSVPTATDNCNDVTISNNITATQDASGVYPLGTTQVVWTATDGCGNTSTCMATVTVEDNMIPTIMCPPALTAQCGPNEQIPYSNLALFEAAGGTVSDNCDIDATSFTLLSSVSDNAVCPETITRTYQISDVNGNTATCTQELVVDDTIIPSLVCSGDFTVSTDAGLCNAMVSLSIPTTDDNCGVMSLTNNITGAADASGVYDIGTTTIVWTVTDLCGNTNTCEVNVTVEDSQNPTITCPVMLDAQCDISEQTPYADLNAFIAAGGAANDNCDTDLALSLLSEVSDGMTCPETITRVYQVSDDSGNTATCSQTVVVDDTMMPTITCPLDITVNAPTGTCEAMVTISIPDTDDNCEVVSVTNDFNNTDDASGIYTVGTTMITYTVVDGCGNLATCSFNVTVNDIDPPTFDCTLLELAFPLVYDCSDGDPIDIITKYVDDVQNSDVIASLISDLCDDDVLLENDYDGVSFPEVSCDESEGLTITFTATDDSGNSASCSVEFILMDDTPPTFDSTPSTLDDITCEDEFPIQETLTASDDCGIAAVTPSIDPFVVDQCNGYNVTYRWTATDECGNSAETTQTFRVLPDTTPPSFDNTPDPIMDIDCDEELPEPQLLTASDTCQDDPAMVTFAVLPFIVDQCNGYTITYQWTATDNCNNTTTTTQTINIRPDITPPVFVSSPAPIDDISCQDDFPTPEVLVADDTCQDTDVQVVVDVLPFVEDQCAGYTVTYQWTATDNCGNSAQTSQSFNVLPDTEGPVFDTQPMALPDINCDDPFPAIEMLSATDACQTDAVTIETSVSQTSADFCSGYTVTYTWTATDNCDNTTTVETSFEILPDMEDPTFDMEAPMISDINCDDELPLFPVVTASDNCDPSPDVTTDIVPFVVDQCNGYPVTYVWTATDVCGNSSTLSTTFMVLADTTPPVFDSQPTELPDISCDTVLPTQETLSATDACGSAMVVASIDPFVVDICAGYTVTHRWVATDACGNSATVTESFEVLPDTTPPVFDSMPTALPDISCDTPLPAQEVLTASDDCSSLNVVATIDPFVEDTCNGYMVTHRWVATDACMNSTTVTESFMVLPDTEAPTFDSTPAPLADIPCSASFPDQEDITATDNCNGATVVETVDPFVADICNGYTVTYRWTATDACGNNTETTQSFNVLPDTADPTFDSTPMPIADINCDDPFPTQEVLTASDDCGMVTIVTSTDPFNVDVCGGYTVTYRWVATDACSNSTEVTQSFNVLPDTESPVLTCSDITVGTDDGVCEALVTVLAPPFTDDCSNVSFTNDLTGNADASGVYPEGTTTITWTATDACGNTSSCMQSITVVDDESPVITCLGTACLFLDANGEVSLDPDDYVLTYSDNCSDRNDIMITGRRLEMNGGPCANPDNDVLGESVSFCCADAGTTVMVELQANDETGNVTACMIQVEIKDNRAPILVAPSVCLPDITVSCEFDFDYDDLSVFGSIVFDAADVEDIVINDPFYAGTGNIAGEDALFSDNCPDGLSVSESTVGVDDLVCNQGTVTRTLVVTDASGNTTSCVQMITVEDIDPFDEDDIEWPADFEFTNCADFNPDPSVTGQPVLNIDKCSQPGFNSSDQVFNYPIEGCQLIRRTWTVIDWCQYVANSGSNTGLFTYVQDIVLTNSVAPEFTFDCEDTTICANELTCQGELNITATATDDCTPTADLAWSYSFDLFDAGTTVFNNTGNTITGTYPRGTHRLTWNVEDRCGNTSTCSYLLTIRDCKAPTVVCKFGLSTSLMPMNGTGMIEIWANDFVQSASDNCTLVDDLEYSFSSDITDKSLMFTCLDLGEQEVEVWATDEDGNQSRCITFIDIQDNNNACDENADERAMISGRVSTQDYDGILDAEISIESTDVIESMMSIDDGDFAFADVPMYLDYEVKAYKNDNPMNGVSTLDLLIIQKHILGINPLQTPYDRIAADINNSESISAVDLIELRKLILGVYSELPNNDSWRFVDASFEFEDEETPWPFQEEITYSNLLSDEMDSDFIGIKIGDVNGSVTANLKSGSVESRSNYEGVELYIDDVEYSRGEEVTVPIRVSQPSDIHGLQMQLAFDQESLELIAIVDGAIHLEPSEYNNTATHIGLSWMSIEGESLGASDKLMSLVFQAKADGNLESIQVTHDQIVPEVYNQSLETGPIELELRIMNNGGFELAQNKPNPFKNGTEISFHLPEAGPTTLIVYDAQGKLILSQRNEYEAGWNTIQLQKADLQVGSGVLYYKLKAGSFTETKQMLLID